MRYNRFASILASVSGIGIFLAVGLAEASSGTVSGKLQFHNKNGNYCPSGANCTGSLYTWQSYNTLVGVPEIDFEVRRTSDSALIGAGETDSSGNYSVSWATSSGTSSVEAKIRVYYRHKDLRFALRELKSTTPPLLYNDGGPMVLAHGGHTNAPVVKFGNSAAPNRLMNVYWAAWKMWNKLKLSGRMSTYFTNVDILTFEKTAAPYFSGSDCSTAGNSCALPYMKNLTSLTSPQRPAYARQAPTIVLDGWSASPYSPQHKVMHEMGHIADFLSGPSAGLARSTGYDYDAQTPSGWGFTSNEYRPTALSEGLATFLAVSAFHNGNAPEAYTCVANGHTNTVSLTHCYPGGVSGAFTLEARPGGACAAPEGRRMINALRFFWDIYDTPADGTDATDLDFGDILNTLAVWPCTAYPACYGAGQLHDQFSSVAATFAFPTRDASLAQRDEGNAWRFRNVMFNNFAPSTDVQGAYYQNCMASY